MSRPVAFTPEQVEDIRDWWYGPLQPSIPVIAAALNTDRKIIARIIKHQYRW